MMRSPREPGADLCLRTPNNDGLLLMMCFAAIRLQSIASKSEYAWARFGLVQIAVAILLRPPRTKPIALLPSMTEFGCLNFHLLAR